MRYDGFSQLAVACLTGLLKLSFRGVTELVYLSTSGLICIRKGTAHFAIINIIHDSHIGKSAGLKETISIDQRKF